MNEGQRIPAVVFLIAVTSILGGAVATTLYLPESEIARGVYRLLCHGREDRAFVLGGAAMPLCARCVGIYSGIITAIIALPLSRFLRRRTSNLVLLVSALPLVIDGSTQATGLRESTNLLRFATGIVAGFVFLIWALTRMGDRGESIHQKVA